jgi:aspartyl-tRNA(Asn)/glutamyl-tRNA(Gln) amidotransferase subunit A
MPLSSSLDHVGVLARTVDDCATILQVIAGHDVEDPSTSRRPVPDYLGNGPRSLKDLRVAVPRNWFHDRVDDAVLGHLEESIRVVRQEGATIVDTTIPADIELASPLASLIMAVETAMVHGQKLLNDPGAFSPAQYRRLIAGIYYPATRYLEALALRGQITRTFCESVFRSADVLHVPSVPVPVPTIEETDLGSDPSFGAFVERFTGFNRPFNFMGLPTLCLPAGLDANGLPVGFQLVGRPFSESTLFHAGRTYEAATGFGRVIPPLIAARPGSGPGWTRTDVQSGDHFSNPLGSPQH